MQRRNDRHRTSQSEAGRRASVGIAQSHDLSIVEEDVYDNDVDERPLPLAALGLGRTI